MPVGPKLLMRPGKDDHTVERFLDNFYKVAAETLFRPLTTEVPMHEDVKSEYISMLSLPNMLII